MMHAEYLPTILRFLSDIGLTVELTGIDGPTFLPGIAIHCGSLRIDAQKLEWPGDLLHEAGHLAVLPATMRAQASDALSELPVEPEDAEQEALAWSYAAAVHLSLPLDVLFHNGGYKGKSATLIQLFSLGIYPGVRGLCQSGMTASPGFTSPAVDGVRYPQMIRWLRE